MDPFLQNFLGAFHPRTPWLRICVEWLTDSTQGINKSCKIGLASKLTFKVIYNLRVTTGCILLIGHSAVLPLNSKVTLHYGLWYCVTFEFKLRYLKNLKLFSITLKEPFEPIVFPNKMRRLLLFKNIFLRNRSFSNVR